MRKKLSLLLVALIAIAAFAVQASRAIGDTFTLKLDGSATSNPTNFFTVSKTDGNSPSYNAKYVGKYNGVSYAKPLKVESATQITFTSLAKGTLTVVQSTKENGSKTIKLDGNAMSVEGAATPSDDKNENVRVYTIENLGQGNHVISRGDGESGILYVQLVYTAEHEHDYVYDESLSSPPTCTEDGKSVSVCICGDKDEETIPALGHDLIEVTTPPTCTEEGSVVQKCNRCTFSNPLNTIPALGHDFNDNGICIRCGYDSNQGGSTASEETISFTAAGDGTNPMVYSTDHLTFTFDKGQGSTNPAYNTTAGETRLYAKGFLTIAGKKGVEISKIVYNYTINPNKNGIAPTIDGVAGSTAAGTWDADNKTWTGADNQVVMTTSGTAGNLGFKSITVTFTASEVPVAAVATPVISGTTPFIGSTTVAITCETQDAAIYYTTDGADPTNESTAYIGPFTLTASATVKAIAYDDAGASSEIASKDFVATPTVATVAELNALADKTEFAFTGEALVVAKPTAKYVYIRDETGSSLIYDNSGAKTEAAIVGKTLSANWTGKVSIFNGLFEAVPDAALAVKEGDPVEVEFPNAELSEITEANVNKVVTIGGVLCKNLDDNGNFNITPDNGEEITVAGRNTFGLEGIPVGKRTKIIGAIGIYKKNETTTVQFQPIAFLGYPTFDPDDLLPNFNLTWHGSEETIVPNIDGTVTYNADQWGGMVAMFEDVDMSAYQYLVFEFAEATPCAVNPLIIYANGTEQTANYKNAGKTVVVSQLNAAGAAHVSQIVLQAGEKASLKISKVYLTNDPPELPSVELPGFAIWSSETPFAVDWSNVISVAANNDNLAGAKVGDVIHVAVEGVPDNLSSIYDAQVALSDGAGTAIEGGVPVGSTDITEAVFVITGDMLKFIQASGLVVSGVNYSSKLVTLESCGDEPRGSDNSIWLGYQTGGNFPISYVHFDNANNKTKVAAGDIIRVTTIANEGDNKWMELVIKGDWNNGKVSMTDKGNGTFEYVVTADDVDNLTELYKSTVINFGDYYTITQVELIPKPVEPAIDLPGLPIWSSVEPVAVSWDTGNIKAEANNDNLAGAKVGDFIHVAVEGVTAGDPWSAQVCLREGLHWNIMEAGIPVGDGTVTDAKFQITGDMLQYIQAGGVMASGSGYSTRLMTLESCGNEALGSDQSIWLGNTTGQPSVDASHFANANGGYSEWKDGQSTHFNGVAAGDIIRVTATAIDGFEGDSYVVLSHNVQVSDTEWQWINYDGMTKTATNTGFDFVVNADNVDALMNDGIIINQQGYTITQVELIPKPDEPAPLYVIGDISTGGWVRTDMTQMEYNEQTQAYEYSFTNDNEFATFAIATYQMTAEEAEADEDWSTFNAEYRYAIGDGDVDASDYVNGDAVQLVKGTNNGTVKLPKGTYTVSVDPETMMMTITGTITPKPKLEYEAVYVAGNGTEGSAWMNGVTWDPLAEANKMTKVEGKDDVWEIVFKDVPAGEDYQFKFIPSGEWSANEETKWSVNFGGEFFAYGIETPAAFNSNGNIVFTTTAEQQDITLRINLSDYNPTTYEGATFTVIAPAEKNIYVVAGCVGEKDGGADDELFGKVWDGTAEANQLAYDETSKLYTKTYEGVTFEAETQVKFKIVINGVKWIPAEDQICAIPAAGTYDITVTYNAETGEATMTATPIPEDIVINPEDITGGDITAAIAAKSAGKTVKNLTINLAAGEAYTLSKTITAPNNLVLKGDDKNPATITLAADMNDNVITLDGTEAVAKKSDGTDSDHKLIESVEISGVKIFGLKAALIKDNQKTLVEKLTIADAIVEVPAAAKNVLDFNQKGYAGKVTVVNSTIYAKDKNTGFFAQYGSRPKNIDGNWLQEFDVQNSTIVNIANGKNFCDLKQNGTAQNVYTLKNNIFTDCGKSIGQVVVGFNKGQTSATPVWDVDGNVFNWSGADASAAEVEKAGQKDDEDIVKNSHPGVIAFTDAANGDFNGVFTAAPVEEEAAGEATSRRADEEATLLKYGDPRWTIELKMGQTITIADNIQHGTVVADMKYAGQGTVVTITATPEENFKLERMTVEGENVDLVIEVTMDPENPNVGTFTMPAGPVIVRAMFRPAQLYAIGINNNWDRTNMTQLEYNAETLAFETSFTTEGGVCLAIATYQMTTEEANADEDWSTFNANYRYAIGDGDVDASGYVNGDAVQLVKGTDKGTVKLPAGEYKISVSNDFMLTITGTIAPEPKLKYDAVYVAGNAIEGSSWMNGITWDPLADANKMTPVDGMDDVWEITFKDVSAYVGYEFKFVVSGDWSENNAWDVNFGGDFVGYGIETPAAFNRQGNIVFNTTAESQDITLRIDLSDYNPTTHEGATFTVIAPAEKNIYVVAGCVGEKDGGADDELFGKVWDGTAEANQLAYDETSKLYTKTYEGVTFEAETQVKFKIVINGVKWVPAEDQICAIPAAGTYDITVTYNAETGETTMTALAGTDGVNGINASKYADGEWYTTGGVRIDKPTKKGLYIHNGRTVIVK